MLSPVLARWSWFALVASAAMLGVAHAFETFGHMAPCHLCLKEREAYWISGSIALAGVVLDLTPLRARAGRIVCAVLVLAFLYSLGWAAYHAGVEQKWWEGPKGYTGGGGPVTAGDIAAGCVAPRAGRAAVRPDPRGRCWAVGPWPAGTRWCR